MGDKAESGNVLTVLEHFRMMMEEGLPKIAVGLVSRELKDKGRTEEDIETALHLMACIVTLDLGLFPQKDRVLSLDFVARKHKFGRIADYRSKGKCQEEGYTVFAEDISRNINNPVWKVLRVDSAGRILDDYADAPMASFEARMIGIAAHEVRHRLQRHRRVRMFSPRDIDACGDEFLRTFIEFASKELERDKQLYLEEKKSGAFIRSMTRPCELDARIIEELVVSKIHDNITLKELHRLLRSQSSI